MNTVVGFISIFLTIFIWGTWLIFSRKASKKLGNPFIENLLITIGALICNSLIFGGYIIYSGGLSLEWQYIVYPLLSGILWAFAGLFAFLSIEKIGVGKAMSIWAPSGMIVSFLWGVLYYGEFAENTFIAVFSILLIVGGVYLVIQSRSKSDSHHLVFKGVLFALLASCIWGGTYLVPLKELSDDISPLFTLFPLSFGMCIGAFGILFVKSGCSVIFSLKKSVISPIILSGFMWGIGNFFAIIAVLNIGMGKAYPMAELCGVVNALFAVYFLKEVPEARKMKIFLGGTTISFSGAILLSILKI